VGREEDLKCKRLKINCGRWRRVLKADREVLALHSDEI